MTTIRRLNRGEGKLYKETRLAALKDSPEAFSSTYEDALKRTEQSWVEQADSSAEGSDRATFIAMEDHPVGLAAIYRDKDEPNVGELLQVWVAPEKRGGSAAYDLLNALMKWAISSGFSRVKAEVEISNLRALQFYEKFGFTRSTDMAAHSGSSVMLTMPIVSEIMKLHPSFSESLHQASQRLACLLPRGCIVSALSENGVESYHVEGQDFPTDYPCQNLVFEIGSTGKIFTSLLLCIAISEKKVTFESTLGEFLPEPDRLHSSVKNITFRELVTHTSGLPRDPEHPIETWDYYHDKDLIFSREELFAQLYELPLVKRNSYCFSKFGVGDSAGYSNYGYCVLAEIIAIVYKGELHEVMRDKITVPLGLADTVFPNELTESQRQRLLDSFCEKAEMPAEKYDAMAGCGALLSTAADLVKFAKILQKPEGCALEDSIKLLKKRMADFDDLGVGVRTWKYHGEQIYEHGGMTYGCSCLFAFWEKQDRVAVILTSNTALPSWAILRESSGDKTQYTEGMQNEDETPKMNTPLMKLSFLSEHPQHIAEIAKWYYDEWGDPDSSSGLDRFVEYVGKKAVSRMEIPLSFIAHDGGELLGAVELKFREHKGYPEYEHWLGSLYVGENHRGSGVAAALIDCAKSHSACLKLEKLYLQCEPDLVKMYEKHGFQELHKARYGNLDTIIMVWNVS